MHMQAIRVYTTVQPGRKIEVSSPEFPSDGEPVEIIVMSGQPLPHRASEEPIVDLLRSFHTGQSPSACATWEEYERLLAEEKASWE